MSESSPGPHRRPARQTSPTAAAARRLSTKELLIDTAEQLFGRFGLDGVSLREIATTAGQANSNAVQYHFKDKAGLVSAILEDRVERLEPLRCEQLTAALALPATPPRELLKVLWLPSLSVRDGDGVHTFCRFLLQHMLQPGVTHHPLQPLYGAKGATAANRLPCLVNATRLLRAHYDAMPKATLNRRMSALSIMFLATVVEHDNARLGADLRTQRPPAAFNIEPILDMAIGALAAPC